MDFYNKDNYTLQDIEDLIHNEVEENIHLDYKAAGALAKDDKKRHEVTKDVSAFANSDGGIIVYGVSEQGYLPKEITPIDGKIYTKEWLETIIQSIQPRIREIKIFPIRIDDSGQSIYVVKIPRSDNAPHMAQDNRYYRRYNFQSVPMEDYEVKDLYNRVSVPKIEIERCVFAEKEVGREEITYLLKATIHNIGNRVCESYKLNFYINNATCCTFSHQTLDIRNLVTEMDNDRAKLSACSQAPIYPEEFLDMGIFQISVKKQHNKMFLANLIIDMILFCDGNKDEVAYIPLTGEYIDEREEVYRLLKEHWLNLPVTL